MNVSLRVDIAGGWLDVPGTLSDEDKGFIVNCAISPHVSRDEWSYKIGSGLGGSAALDIIEGRNPFECEAARGVGWQDPAVLIETGLCVWRAGDRPHLVRRSDGAILAGCMAIKWTRDRELTAGRIAAKRRPLGKIQFAGRLASDARTIEAIAIAVNQSYQAQLEEGMHTLATPRDAMASKYCGAGWGGYALHLFGCRLRRDKWVADDPEAIAVEPLSRFSPAWYDLGAPIAVWPRCDAMEATS